jgi:hypothetical protein
MDEIKKFFEELKKDENASKLFSGKKPDTEEELIDCYIKVAEQLGYSITAEALKEEMDKTAAEIAKKNDSTIEGIKEVSVEDMDAVAGGRMLWNCEYTYKDEENCWSQDACDVIITSYYGYKCNHLMT